MSATGGKNALLSLVLLLLVPACKPEKPVEIRKPEEPTVIIKPRNPVLTLEQRAELAIAPELIGKIELSAGAEAEPFFVIEVFPSENLKGEKGFEQQKLAGFSVRTKNSDELIRSYRAGLRVKGLLIFKSHRGYGSLPDIVSVVRGNNSYDILKIQRTEADSYNLDTSAIIAWLKEQQKISSFVITGAGPDWVEAKFIRQPETLNEFAARIYAFAPDVRGDGPQTAGKLAERIRKTNGFYLVWD